MEFKKDAHARNTSGLQQHRTMIKQELEQQNLKKRYSETSNELGDLR